MKGAQAFVVLLALAAVVGAAASAPEPAPSPKSRVCVPDKWQGLSFTRVEGKHKMVLAKSAVDVDSQKAATEFIVFGGRHHHRHHHHRAELAPQTDHAEETHASLLKVDEDLASHAKKHGKGVVKVIADFAKEKVYITYHKHCGGENVTFCKVKDFDHPADLSTMLCLPEKAKKAGTVVVGGSLDVDMYFIKAKKAKAIVEVSLTSEGNIPVEVNAAKKCKGSVHTAYFNITKEIDEGFFDVPASCGGKLEEKLPFSLGKAFKEPSFGNPAFELFSLAGHGHAEDNDDSNDEGFFGKVAETVAAFWRGIFGPRPLETEGALISAPKIRMYGQA